MRCLILIFICLILFKKKKKQYEICGWYFLICSIKLISEFLRAFRLDDAGPF